eukprot:8496946-Pyramimonas_sp.AAC.1
MPTASRIDCERGGTARARASRTSTGNGRPIKFTLAIDAGYAFQSLSSKDLKQPTECAILGHSLAGLDR